MTSSALLLRPAPTNTEPKKPVTLPDIPFIQPAFSAPSGYGAQRKPNILALTASCLIVGGLLVSLFTMNIGVIHKEVNKLAAFDLLSPPEPPPPPPPSAQPEPVKPTEVSSPIVAPQPLVTTPPTTTQIATSPTPPPPEISVPGPARPAPPAPTPAIENAGDLSSRMISAQPPRYPSESRRKREEGTVVLMVLLSADGTIANIAVHSSSGFDRLDNAALSAVRRWRWSPTIRNGTAIMVKGLVEIPFVLQKP